MNATTRLKLVSVILAYERADSLIGALPAMGIHGFTSTKVDGRGHFGVRQRGFLDAANVRIDVLARTEAATALLAFVATEFADEAIVAFAMDVDAVPNAAFE